jgi:hypothetical protein
MENDKNNDKKTFNDNFITQAFDIPTYVDYGFDVLQNKEFLKYIKEEFSKIYSKEAIDDILEINDKDYYVIFKLNEEHMKTFENNIVNLSKNNGILMVDLIERIKGKVNFKNMSDFIIKSNDDGECNYKYALYFKEYISNDLLLKHLQSIINKSDSAEYICKFTVNILDSNKKLKNKHNIEKTVEDIIYSLDNNGTYILSYATHSKYADLKNAKNQLENKDIFGHKKEELEIFIKKNQQLMPEKKLTI